MRLVPAVPEKGLDCTAAAEAVLGGFIPVTPGPQHVEAHGPAARAKNRPPGSCVARRLDSGLGLLCCDNSQNPVRPCAKLRSVGGAIPADCEPTGMGHGDETRAAPVSTGHPTCPGLRPTSRFSHWQHLARGPPGADGRLQRQLQLPGRALQPRVRLRRAHVLLPVPRGVPGRGCTWPQWPEGECGRCPPGVRPRPGPRGPRGPRPCPL